MSKSDLELLRDEDGIDLLGPWPNGPRHNFGVKLGETVNCGELVCLVTSIGYDGRRIGYVKLTPVGQQVLPCQCKSCQAQGRQES